MALIRPKDVFMLGTLDVTDRLQSCDLQFGFDPATHQIVYSFGRLVLRNSDGLLDSSALPLRITRPTLPGTAARQVWFGVADPSAEPIRSQTTRSQSYTLHGNLETVLGFGAELDIIYNGPNPRNITAISDPMASKSTTSTTTSTTLYLAWASTSTRSRLYRINTSSTTQENNLGNFPSGMQIAAMTTHGSNVYAIDLSSNRARMVLVNTGSPGSSAYTGSGGGNLHRDINYPQGLASHNGSLYLVDSQAFSTSIVQRALWQVNLSNPAQSTYLGLLPLNDQTWSLADHNGALYMAPVRGDELWLCNVSRAESSRKIGDLPSAMGNIEALVSHAGTLYAFTTEEELWRINVTSPNSSRKVGDLPSGIRSLGLAGAASITTSTTTTTTVPGRTIPTGGLTMTGLFNHVVDTTLSGNTVGARKGTVDIQTVRFNHTNNTRTLVGRLKIFEDGSANISKESRRVNDWLTVISKITHCPVFDVDGSTVGISQGARNQANRNASRRFSSRDVLITPTSVYYQKLITATINAWKFSFANINAAQKVAQIDTGRNLHFPPGTRGERAYVYPQWIAGGTSAESIASLPERLIRFECPRWQETETAIGLIEGLVPGTVHLFNIEGDDGLALINQYGMVARLAYSWRANVPPKVTVDVLGQPESITPQGQWIQGQAVQGSTTILTEPQ